MTLVFQAKSDRVLLTKGGVTKFDTNLKSFGLDTPDKITLTATTITFPDLVKSNMYYWNGNHPDASHNTEQAAVFISFPKQEWNKDAASPYTLPDILVGTAPAGTDYLDLQVNLTRTTNPTAILGDTVKPLIPAGYTVNCLGGSCLLEHCAPLVRGFAVLLGDTNLDGTINVYLRRYQSTRRDNRISGISTGWSSANSSSDGDRFTYGANGKGIAIYLAQQYGPTTVFDPSQTFTHQRGGSNGLSLTDATNFTSVYTGDLIITPGSFNVPPAPSVPTSPYGNFADAAEDLGASLTTSRTYTALNFGYADATRKMVVAIMGIRSNAGTDPHVTGVTIGGVAATLVKNLDTIQKSTCIWIANVPTGVSGDVVVTFSGMFNKIAVALFSLYNMTTSTPLDTDQLTLSGSLSTISLNEAAGGFVLAAAVQVNSPGTPIAISFSGMGNDTTGFISGAGGGAMDYGYAFEDTAATAAVTLGSAYSTSTPQTVFASFH
jgi:hypothetical protein